MNVLKGNFEQEIDNFAVSLNDFEIDEGHMGYEIIPAVGWVEKGKKFKPVVKSSKPIVNKISKPAIKVKKIKGSFKLSAGATEEDIMYDLIMKSPVIAEDMFDTVEELHAAYPELKFSSKDENSHEISLFWWHDIAKQASPKGEKNELRYNPELFKPLIQEAYLSALASRNLVKRALSVVKAAGNKKALLKVLSRIENVKEPYTTGGDPRPATRRIVLFYEREGGVKAKKRKSTIAAENRDLTSSSSSSSLGNPGNVGNFAGSPLSIVEYEVFAPEPSSPKRVKVEQKHSFAAVPILSESVAAAAPAVSAVLSSAPAPVAKVADPLSLLGQLEKLNKVKLSSDDYTFDAPVLPAGQLPAAREALGVDMEQSAVDCDIINYFALSAEDALVEEWDGSLDGLGSPVSAAGVEVLSGGSYCAYDSVYCDEESYEDDLIIELCCGLV